MVKIMVQIYHTATTDLPTTQDAQTTLWTTRARYWYVSFLNDSADAQVFPSAN